MALNMYVSGRWYTGNTKEELGNTLRSYLGHKYGLYSIGHGSSVVQSLMDRGFSLVFGKRRKPEDDAPVKDSSDKKSDQSHGGNSFSGSVQREDAKEGSREGNHHQKDPGGGGNKGNKDRKGSEGPSKSKKGKGVGPNKKGLTRAQRVKAGQVRKEGQPSVEQKSLFAPHTKGGRSNQAFIGAKYSLSSQEIRFVRRTADLILQKTGIGKPVEEPQLDPIEFVYRNELCLDVTPAIEEDLETESAPKVLLSVDRSGSCHGNSDVSAAISEKLQEQVEAVSVDNVNGSFFDLDLEESKKLSKDCDLVIYIGDMDGYELLSALADNGVTVILLDTTSHNRRDPYVKEKRGGFLHISAVKVAEAEGIYEALKLL